MNNIYKSLSRVKFLSRSYTFKFLFVAFLGIHIPLLGLLAFIIFNPLHITPLYVFLVVLGLTLLATAITLYILNGLLVPLKKSQVALQNYLTSRTLPDLPVTFVDEAGMVMRDIQQTVGQLDFLLEEKRDLAGFLSHDLRIPLLSTKMFGAELAEGNKSQEEVKQLAGKIIRSAEDQERLLEKVLELLEFDDTLKINSQLEKSCLTSLVQNAAESLQPIAEKKNVSIVVDATNENFAMVSPVIFSHAIKNLINNAVKFSNPGTEIKINLNKSSLGTKISVADQGIGFGPAVADTLLQRFTKGRKGTQGEPSTGLGLYITKKIVENHNGVLTAGSDGEGKGATFTIHLYE